MIPTTTEQRIIAACRPDLYASEIAADLSVDVQHVYRTVRKFGLTIKKFSYELTHEQEEIIREAASPEVGVKRLCELTGAHRLQVQDFLTANNLPRKRAPERKPTVKSGKDVFCWKDYENRLF